MDESGYLAEYATGNVDFALAQILAAWHTNPAFQASSPKLPRPGRFSDRAFFLDAKMNALRVHVSVHMLSP